MAAGGYAYQTDGLNYPEVQIRMKVDIFTEGPTAGLTFNQTVHAPPPDGVYPGDFTVSYPKNALTANTDASRMLPWKDELNADTGSDENKVRYRKHQGGKNGRKLKDKTHGSSGSLESRKSAKSGTESSQADDAEKLPRAKPRRRNRDEVLKGNDLDTTPETESFEIEPPLRPRNLPGAVPVLPVSIYSSSQEQAPLLPREQSSFPVQHFAPPQKPAPVPLEVVPQDVLINTFEDQKIEKETTSRNQTVDLRQQPVAVPNSTQNYTPRILRATEETVTTTQMRFEQVRATLSARRPTTQPPTPPVQLPSKPKMVSTSVQTPKQRVSFDNSPPIPIERPVEETLDSTSSSFDRFAPGSQPEFQKYEEVIVPKYEQKELIQPIVKKPVLLVNKGVETTINDPGVTEEATQTDIPEPKPRKLVPNRNTTETLIDDPGFIVEPPAPPSEVETIIDDPGLTTEGIQTDFYDEESSFFEDEPVQKIVTPPPDSYASDLQYPFQDQVIPPKIIATSAGTESSETSSVPTPSPTNLPPPPFVQEHLVAQDTSFHSELNASKDSTSYADYVVQHRLMPSAKIFEMYTSGKSPAGSIASKSPVPSGKTSPSHLQITEPSQTLNRSQEISDNSIDEERSSVSGRLSQRKLYAIKETKTIEETVERFAEDGTSSVVTETKVETSLRSPESTLSSVGRPKPRDNTLLKNALVKTNPAMARSVQVASSRNSIDSERSSLSGLVKSGGAYNYRDLGSSLGSAGDENLSDYLQGRMSPFGDRHLGSYADTLSQDSVISEASLKADRSHEIYEKIVQPVKHGKERSFAEIMGLNLASRSQEYNPETKSAIADARREFFAQGGSSTSVSSYGSFRQDPIRQATVMTRPPFHPTGAAVYGHATPGTIESKSEAAGKMGAKKVSMSPTSL